MTVLARVLSRLEAPVTHAEAVSLPGGANGPTENGLFPMASEIAQTDNRRGFGRGSAVRDYWLQRCEGFQVIRADGRLLGRVRRLETGRDGTFLRMSGLRSRVVPLSAIDTVWPAASLLLIAEPETHEGARNPRRSFPADADTATLIDGSRSRWEDETVPWWELVRDQQPALEGLSGPPRRPLLPGRSRAASRGHARMSSFRPASAMRLFVGNLFADMTSRSARLAVLVHRHGQSGWRATRATIGAIPGRWSAARAFGTRLFRHGRLILGRVLLRFAIWVAGDRKRLVEHAQPPDFPAGHS